MYEYEGGKWSPSRMITVLQVNVIAFIFTSGFGQIIVYIVRIRGKMGYLIIENLNLLNKMNEGLIVVDDSDFELKIASIPAIKLLKQQPLVNSNRNINND